MKRRSAQPPHPRAISAGTVALLSAEQGRYTVAQQCFDALDLPKGTVRVRYAGRSNIAEARNAIVESFRGDWLAMIDDDHVYPPDMLMRLFRHLSNPRVDILTPLVVRRTMPHQNVLVTASENPEKPHETRQVVLKPGDSGLLEVEAAGAGIMLIRRRVFEKLTRPWFEWGRTSEDFALCLKAKAAGCRIYCDLDNRVGHILPMIVWPARAADGRFVPMYTHFVSTGNPESTIAAITRNRGETDLRAASTSRRRSGSRPSGR